ncbi:MAG: hypothetical protein A4E53_03507 [Pelotomaculum sp. PtaB.Bin104]|nr:MAG: hypothetical protein A4E53_03507 [Pelotomaculum sp. PtaB.Bin104]
MGQANLTFRLNKKGYSCYCVEFTKKNCYYGCGMRNMNRRVKLLLLVVLTVLLSAGVIVETVHLCRSIHQVGPPQLKGGHSDMLHPQMWMTVTDLARHCSVPEEDIFRALKITPAPGDEQMSLRALSKKYNKNAADMREGLKQLEFKAGKTP